MRRTDLTPPLFESQREQDKFVAVFSFHHFLSEADLLWLAAYKEFNLSDDEAKALVWVRENGAITNAVYRNLNTVDTLNASTHLRRLRDCDLLTKKGKSSATYYLPGPKFLVFQTSASLSPENLPHESNPQNNDPNSVGNDPNPVGNDSNSVGNDPSLVGNDSNLVGNDSNLVGNDSNSVGSDFDAKAVFALLSSDLQREVGELEPRTEKAETRQLILRLCEVRAWRAEELAQLLKRNVRYLRTSYLAPMTREGLLEYAYSASPSHPQQAYRATVSLTQSP